MNVRHSSLLSFLLCPLLLVLPSGAAIAGTGATKVVYHIDDTRNGRFALHLAEDHVTIDPGIKIRVVAYAAGVDFLLSGEKDRYEKPYPPDVETLIRKGVEFRVCSATLGFRDIDKDRVLEGVGLVPSGTYEIIRLQSEEGYVYLKP